MLHTGVVPELTERAVLSDPRDGLDRMLDL
jgi:hypothetical protein